ncbi:unnamed protein product [Nippostrongylus brasiliensis]|uniref:Uncharacterized protein n=1 Tax=Nippostrongylus brasiliensis TaxID=27835 RepID=A0A0N4YXC5_NIPBR|nr:unnamed protein product [Nippostrongylus brasiliensis]
MNVTARRFSLKKKCGYPSPYRLIILLSCPTTLIRENAFTSSFSDQLLSALRSNYRMQTHTHIVNLDDKDGPGRGEDVFDLQSNSLEISEVWSLAIYKLFISPGQWT